MRHTVDTTRRNATVFAASVAGTGLLFLYPTSTNHNSYRPVHAAAAGVVAQPRSTGRTARTPSTLVVNGTAVDTVYGPVQVEIQVRAGRIVRATAIVYPQGSGQDRAINSYAIPALQSETVQAQSAQIDTVSGATYTSDGYRRSLQAALDSAHLR